MRYDVTWDERVAARAACEAAGERSPCLLIGGTRYTGEGYRQPAAQA